MSGIEVAGLVLGGFPIIISALEKWKDGAQVLQDWWQFKREYRRCLHDIEYQRLNFERNLEECLLPLITDNDQLAILIEDAGGDSWKAPELEERLKKRLSDRAYRSYLATIGDMKDTILELQLRVDKIEFGDLIAHDVEQANRTSGSSSFIGKGKSKVVLEAKRVSYTLDKRTRTRLLQEIDDCNKRLRELLATSNRVNALREANKNSMVENKVNKAILQFWKHANSIFELLSKAWTCNCKDQHHTSVLLKHRTSDINLGVRFSFGHEATVPGLGGWRWQEAEVKKLESGHAPNNISSNISTKITRPNGARERFRSQHLKGLNNAQPALRKPNVQPKPYVESNNASLTGGPKNPPSIPKRVSWQKSSKPSMVPIIDLCSTIATSNDSCFGSLQSESCHYSVSAVEETLPSDRWSTISLETLLRNDCSIIFERRQRYLVALTLASSQLQLHSSSWLGAQWSKSDITFPLDNSNPLIKQAYMSKGAASSVTRKVHSQAPIDQTFSTLGILLLELCFGVAFEDTVERRRSVPADGPNAYSDLGAAFEWSTRVAGEAGPEYAEAVVWCLGKISSFTKDDNWRKDLLEKVVVPLEGCYNSLK